MRDDKQVEALFEKVNKNRGDLESWLTMQPMQSAGLVSQALSGKNRGYG